MKKKYLIKNIDSKLYFEKYENGKKDPNFVERNNIDIRIFDSFEYVSRVFENMKENYPELNLEIETIKE